MRIRSHARFGIQTILNSDMQPWVRSKEYPVIFVKNVKYPQSWRRMLPEAELSLDCAACIRILNWIERLPVSLLSQQVVLWWSKLRHSVSAFVCCGDSVFCFTGGTSRLSISVLINLLCSLLKGWIYERFDIDRQQAERFSSMSKMAPWITSPTHYFPELSKNRSWNETRINYGDSCQWAENASFDILWYLVESWNCDSLVNPCFTTTFKFPKAMQLVPDTTRTLPVYIKGHWVAGVIERKSIYDLLAMCLIVICSCLPRDDAIHMRMGRKNLTSCGN